MNLSLDKNIDIGFTSNFYKKNKMEKQGKQTKKNFMVWLSLGTNHVYCRQDYG